MEASNPAPQCPDSKSGEITGVFALKLSPQYNLLGPQGVRRGLEFEEIIKCSIQLPYLQLTFLSLFMVT